MMVDTVMAYSGKSVAGAIKDARRAAGLTQQELADKLGYTRPVIANWETGKRDPSVAAFLKILDICDTHLSEILPIETSVDVKLNELLSLWKGMSAEQRMGTLDAARKQVSSGGR